MFVCDLVEMLLAWKLGMNTSQVQDFLRHKNKFILKAGLINMARESLVHLFFLVANIFLLHVILN